MSIRNVAIQKKSLVDIRDQPCSDLFLDLFKKAAEELSMSYKDDKCGFTFCSPICPPNTEVVYDNDTKELCITVGDSTVCAIIDIDPPVTSEDTPSINISGLGIIGDPLSADVNISADAGNTIIINADGLYSAGADAQNGLNLTSGFVELGGTLLHNTTLDTSTFNYHTIGNGLFYDSFPNTRDDSGSNTPLNFLYTDANGLLLSGDLNYIINNVPVVDTNLFNTDLTATSNRTHTNSSFDISFTGDGKFFYYNQLVPTTTLGSNNTRVGFNAMANATANTISNIAIGNTAGNQLGTALSNIAIGDRALSSAINLSNSVAIGFRSLEMHTANGVTGTPNIGIGALTLSLSTTSSENIGIGFGALRSIVATDSNIAVGHRAAIASVSNANNTILGNNALQTATTDNNENILIGNDVLHSSLSNIYFGTPLPNVIIGFKGGELLPLSAGNTLIGWKVMEGVTSSTANLNVAVGYNSMKGQTLAASTAVGYNTMQGPAPSSVAIGFNALKLGGITGFNVAIGSNSLSQITSGGRNTAVNGGFGLTSGSDNVLVGLDAGSGLSTGNSNTFVGTGAGQGIVSGNTNTLIGYHAIASAAGSGNVAIGYRAGDGYLGSNKLFIANGQSTTVTTGDTVIQGDFTKAGVNSSLNLRFPGYPTVRDNSSTVTPTNFLYTDSDGNVLSAPTSLIGGGGGNTFINIGFGQGVYESTVGSAVRLKSIKGDGTTINVTSDADEVIISAASSFTTATVRFGIVLSSDTITTGIVSAANPYSIISGTSQYMVNIPKVQDAALHTGVDLTFFIAEPLTEPLKEASLLFRNVSSTFLQEDVNTGPTPLFTTSTVGAYRVYSMVDQDATMFTGNTLGPVVLSSPAEVSVVFPPVDFDIDIINNIGTGFDITDTTLNGNAIIGVFPTITPGTSDSFTSTDDGSDVFAVTISGVGSPSTLVLSVNGGFVECIDVIAAGVYTFAATTVALGDLVEITLTVGTCV